MRKKHEKHWRQVHPTIQAHSHSTLISKDFLKCFSTFPHFFLVFSPLNPCLSLLNLSLWLQNEPLKTNPIKSGYQDQCPDNPCEKKTAFCKLAANGLPTNQKAKHKGVHGMNYNPYKWPKQN